MKEQLTANIISKNILSKVDSEGHHYPFLTNVTDNKRYDSAITNMSGFIKSSNGNIHWKKTTCTWKLLVEYKDGPIDWVKLKELKQSNPVKLSEYTVVY